MNTILTDDEIDTICDRVLDTNGHTCGSLIARAVEAVVLAKLAQQAPAGTVISYHTEDGHTKWTFQPSQSAWAIPRDDKAMERGARSCFVVFTHPAPQQADRQRVPEGWKLVPVEPTERMCKAAADAWLDCHSKMVLNKAGAAAKAAIAAAPEAPAQADRQRVPYWRPIETAPKDATAILVMRDIWPGTESGRAEECNGHNTYVAQWWEGEKNGAGAWICYMDAVCDPVCPIEPTHWMPLPAPPKA